MNENVNRKSFAYWYKNVFSYHYKYIALAVAFAVIFLIVVFWDIITRVNPDMTVVFAATDVFFESEFNDFKAVLEDTVGDLNGDGQVNIQLLNYYPSLKQNDPESAQELNSLDANVMGDDSTIFYVLQKELLKRYDEDWFARLDSLGVDYDGDEKFIYANDLAVFSDIERMTSDFYIGIIDYMRNEKYAEKEKYITLYHKTAEVLDRLIDGE